MFCLLLTGLPLLLSDKCIRNVLGLVVLYINDDFEEQKFFIMMKNEFLELFLYG